MNAPATDSSVVAITTYVERASELLARCTKVQEAKEVLDQAATVREYWKRTKAALEAQASAAVVIERAHRRIGELCLEIPKEQGRRTSSHGEKKSKAEVLTELKISPASANRWEKLASVPEGEFEARVEQLRARIIGADSSGVAATSAAAGYDGDESYTPAKYLDLAREVLGEIDLDPASCEVAQKTVRAKRWFSKQQNGLGRPWTAKAVWLNSPYSFPAVGDFQAKFVGDHAARYFASGLTLVNNATETAWFQQLLKHFPVCFPDHRISFVNAQGVEMTQNRQAQAFFYAGPKLPLFRRTFGQIGKVMVPA